MRGEKERKKQEKVRSERAREWETDAEGGSEEAMGSDVRGDRGDEEPKEVELPGSGPEGRPEARVCPGPAGPGVAGIGRGVPPGARAPRAGRSTHRAAAAAAALRAAPAIQQRRRAPPRVGPARLCLPAPSPEPPPARGHVTRDPSGTRRAARRGVGRERRSRRASASRPWGTREAGALPPGRTRGGGEGRAEVGAPGAGRSARLGRAGAAAPQGPRAAGWLGLRVWPPLPLSGRSPARGRTGARSAASRSSPEPGRGPLGSWLGCSGSESNRPGSSMNKGKGKCLPQGGA